jgi:hypothetical protein
MEILGVTSLFRDGLWASTPLSAVAYSLRRESSRERKDTRSKGLVM